MNSIQILVVMVMFGLASLFTGCATKHGTLVPVAREQVTSPHRIDQRYAYLSDQPQFTNQHANLDMLGTASRYYIYALMANNAYDHDPTNPKLPIPGWKFINRHESESGLAFDMYEKADENGKRVVAVVFEGTNNGKDWKLDWSNNFGRGEPAQYHEAYTFLKDLHEHEPNTRIIAVGHSLGGGLALNASVRLPNVDAVVFNSSPRAFAGHDTKQDHSVRVHFTERGEILSFFSASWLRLKFWMKGYSGESYTAYINNFMDYYFLAGSPVKEHSMYFLSRALLMMAISDGNEEARR